MALTLVGIAAQTMSGSFVGILSHFASSVAATAAATAAAAASRLENRFSLFKRGAKVQRLLF